ncbi:hypothetical protein BUE80_DR005103, partial [Diplocarpon rosae]
MDRKNAWPRQNIPQEPRVESDTTAQAELVAPQELAIADATNVSALNQEARLTSRSSAAQLTTASALRCLVLQLSDQEIVDLRIRLNAIKTADNLSVRLPRELQIIIFGYLGLEDLLRIRRVSRSWRAAFSNEDFCLFLLKNHFPQKYDQEYSSLEADHGADNLQRKQQQARVSLKTWFEGAVRSRIRRAQGRYHSTSRNRYADPEASGSGTGYTVKNPQYHHGRIAFLHPGGRKFIVKSLCSDAEGQFTNENREPFHSETWLLSDEYIIAMTIH